MQLTIAQLAPGIAGLFTVPWLAAAGVLAVSIPVIIHLFSRSRRKKRDWGAMRFLQLAFKKQKRRLELEKWLLLLMRCLVVLIAGLALAGPILGGALSRWLAGGAGALAGSSGREVYVVVDDGLSSRAAAGGSSDGVRFDRLRELGLGVLEGLSPNDRVLLVRGSAGPDAVREGEALSSLRTVEAAREQLQAMRPGFGPSQVSAALESVAVDLEAKGLSKATGDEVVVLLLSDLARGAGWREQPMPTAVAALGEVARVLVARPEAGSGNVQLQQLSPRRALVVMDNAGGQGSAPTAAAWLGGNSGGGSGGVSVEVGVRRLEDGSSASGVAVELWLVDPNGTAGPRMRRDVNFGPGQSTATLNVELPLLPSTDGGATQTEGRYGVVARVLRGTGSGQADALREDDIRFAVVDVRQRLAVGLIAEAAGTTVASGAVGLRPGAFVRAALSPLDEATGSGVVVEDLAPSGFTDEALARLDAAVVLNPESVSAGGWSSLNRFVQTGGLVWVFPPAGESVEPRGWFELMTATAGLPWTLSDEAVMTFAAPVGLATDGRPPRELVLLSADWSALLGPVRVTRALHVRSDHAEDAWVTLAPSRGRINEATTNNPATVGSAFLLAARGAQARGEVAGEGVENEPTTSAALSLGSASGGRWLLSAVAVDAGWSNLATKPAFPALLQDALRGVLGDTAGRGSATVGSVLSERGAWRGLPGLRLTDEDAGSVGITIDGNEADTVEAGQRVALPGVYALGSTSAVNVLPGEVTRPSRSEVTAVNVPAESGDLRGLTEAEAGAWFDGLGAWSWLDDSTPGSALTQAEAVTNLGWVLLWALLALVVAEMFLARWFSHAEAPRAAKTEKQKNRTAENRKKTQAAAAVRSLILFFVSCITAFLLFCSNSPAFASPLDSLLGLDTVSLSEGATSLGWRYPLPAWAWVLIILAAAAASWASYRHLLGPRPMRYALAGLRGLLILLIAVLLAGPQVVRTDDRVERDVLLVLVDRSASMNVRDVVPPEASSPSENPGNLPGPGPGVLSRDEALRAALSSQGAQVFGDTGLGRERDVIWVGFGERAAELPTPLKTTDATDAGSATAALDTNVLGEASSSATALRTALEEAMRRAAGRAITGIVLLTDGRSPQDTGGELLARLARESVRLYPVPIGAATPPLDLAIARLDPPQTAFINDAVPVTVVVDQPGVAADASNAVDPSRVKVRLVDTQSGEVLDERTLEGVGLNQPLRLQGRSATVGEKPWAVEVVYEGLPAASSGGLDSAAASGELNLINNVEPFTVSLIDRPIRVLYVEGYPRWEYRYLKNMLIREKSIDSSIFLLSADRAFAQEGDTPITRLPEGPEEWRRYDVVVVGDVPDGTWSAEQRKDLHDLVSQRGAGVLWIAGQASTPRSYAGSQLADLLPMREPDGVSTMPWGGSAVRPTPLAETLSLMQLGDTARPTSESPDAPAAGFPSTLSPLRWVQDLGPLKPTVEVLGLALANLPDMLSNTSTGGAAGPLAQETRDTAPLLTRLRFGSGQSLYVATDETWRWRYGRGEIYFERFWVQLVRMLGRSAAQRGDEAVRLAVSGTRLPVGATAVVDLDIEDAALLSRELPSIRVEVRPHAAAPESDPTHAAAEAGSAAEAAGTSQVIELRPVQREGVAGRYTANWTAANTLTGQVELVVTEPALADLDLRARVEVVAPDDELRQSQTDFPRLTAMAEATGGRVIPLGQLDALLEPDLIRNLARKTANDVAEPLGHSALAFALILGLVTLEWVLRKVIRLV